MFPSLSVGVQHVARSLSPEKKLDESRGWLVRVSACVRKQIVTVLIYTEEMSDSVLYTFTRSFCLRSPGARPWNGWRYLSS